MPWITANLRGQKVFARCTTDGTLVAKGGRVEVRYKPSDGRAYQASAANLEVRGEGVLPDDHCADAEAVPRTTEANGATAKTSKAKTSAGTKEQRKAASAKKAVADAADFPKDAFVAYADGACSGNPGPAGLGVVVLTPSGERHEAYEYLGSATNNVAELTAILRVLEAVDASEKVIVHTDSQYSIGVLTKGWKAKANVDLIAKIVPLVKARRGLKVVYVPGHAGVPLNERADELARLAVSSKTSTKLPALAGGVVSVVE